MNSIPRRVIGNSGLEVSTIALGTWLTVGDRLSHAQADALVRTAIDEGVNFIDTAHSYPGAEEALGRLLKGLDRSKLVLMTKCFFNRQGAPLPDGEGLSPANLRHAIDTSLTETGSEVIDLFLCHRFDPKTTVRKVVQTMGSLVQEGKIRAWGVGRWTVSQIEEAIEEARLQGVTGPSVTQDFYNLFNPRAETSLLPFCNTSDFGFVGYSPLARGVLTGKYTDGIPSDSRAADKALAKTLFDLEAHKLEAVGRLRELAKTWDMTAAQAALATTLASPGYTSAIIGARTPSQLKENLQAARLELSISQQAAVRAIFAPLL